MTLILTSGIHFNWWDFVQYKLLIVPQSEQQDKSYQTSLHSTTSKLVPALLFMLLIQLSTLLITSAIPFILNFCIYGLRFFIFRSSPPLFLVAHQVHSVDQRSWRKREYSQAFSQWIQLHCMLPNNKSNKIGDKQRVPCYSPSYMYLNEICAVLYWII